MILAAGREKHPRDDLHAKTQASIMSQAGLRTALAGHLAVIREHGESLPEPSGPGVYVERPVAA